MRSIWRCLFLAWVMWRLSTTMRAQCSNRRIASSSRAISFCWVTNSCCWRFIAISFATA